MMERETLERRLRSAEPSLRTPVYLVDEESSVPLISPKLEACKRTNLNAGQTKEVKFTIRRRNMELLGKDGRFTVEPGRFTVRIGSSSDDIRLQKSFEVR